MVRIILGVIVGFLIWSILWIGSDQVLITLSKNWYGAHELTRESAIMNGTPFPGDNTIFVIHLARSIIISLMSGFLAAFIANENKKAPLVLGVVLLLVGLVVQIMAWNQAPVWYHVIFLLFLVPVTVIGGRLRSRV